MALAIVLGIQCIWILLAELSKPGIDRLPTDATAAAAAANHRNAATWAASIGAFRGDLWAETAFTYANVLWEQAGTTTGPGRPPTTSALIDLNRALGLAPVNPSAWLFLAGFSSRYPTAGVDTIKALKMSYYTGPSEQELIPLRLLIAAHADFVGDFELRQFVTRDLRFLLSQHQEPVVVAAYNSASSSAKPFIEQAVRQIDPSAVKLLQQTPPAQPLPE